MEIEFTVTDDPLSSMPIGAQINFGIVPLSGSDAGRRPDFVRNWGEFRGALLAIGFNSSAGFEVCGSGFVVAPGLAVSATHIFGDRLGVLCNGLEVPYAIGIDGSDVRFWRITSINTAEQDDIALLSIEAASSLPENQTYYHLPLTTRTPGQGETLEIYGFQCETTAAGLRGNMIAASGQVEAVYLHGRDRFMVPYPAIELAAGSLGGMSGGVAVDLSGKVVGMVSTGMTTGDLSGPTYVAMTIKAVNRPVQLCWPRGMHSDPVSLLEMDRRLVYIEGREAIVEVTETDLVFRQWTAPGEL